jgi:hypothetical protein
MEAIQPNVQTATMHTLFEISASINNALTAEIAHWSKKGRYE